PPLQIAAIIDESVLHRRGGETSVMHKQLTHMMTLSELPNVEVRGLPLSGDHLVSTGGFNYLRFRPIHHFPLNDLVVLDNLTGTEYVDAEEASHQYRLAFESLRDNALSAERTRELMASVAGRVWA